MHRPVGYQCPFCRVVAGEDLPGDYTKQADIVFRNAMVTAFISSAWWPDNAGHVLVVPNEHFENIYDISAAALTAIQLAGQQIAAALKVVYGCGGTSFRQHNEPAGDQEVWHYHLHVFPRYQGDELYARTYERRATSALERAPYAQRLREYFQQGGGSLS